MIGLFLQSLAVDSSDAPPLVFLATIFGILGIFAFMLLAGLYLYISFAYHLIGKKARLKHPGLAWIPIVGPLIIAYQISKMPYWPWFLIIGFFIPLLGFIA